MSRRRNTVRQYSAEDQALTDISKEAESRLAAKRAARAEAREIRMKEIERQQKEAEEKERLGNDYGTARSRQQSATGSAGSRESSVGTNESISSKDRDLKVEMRTLQEKYKTAMMTSAQLDNEKQSLVYQVELLKDQFEELTESHTELQREYKEKNRSLELTKRELQAAQLEVKGLREQNDYKDRLIQESGFVIVAAENGDLALERSTEPPSANGPVGSGGLLLSSESLALLNKGREGSLGMDSLASSLSATHTTQTVSSTHLSQPSSQACAEEPQSQSIVHTESAQSVTPAEQSDGSSVDGPMFQSLPKDAEASVESSSRAADKAETGVSVEAVETVCAQPGAAISHSPQNRESHKSVQESDESTVLDNDDSGLKTGVCEKVVGEDVTDLATSHEGKGNESEGEGTSDGMLTPLHGVENDSSEDRGREASDRAGEGEQQSGDQSNIPSVVVTECSHSQQVEARDSDDDVDEFFDAVSTPLPSPMLTEFEFEGPEKNVADQDADQIGNQMAGLAAGTVSSVTDKEFGGGDEETGREDDKEVGEDDGKEIGKDGGDVDGEGDKEVDRENGKEVDVVQEKEVDRQNDKESDEEHDKETDREENKVTREGNESGEGHGQQKDDEDGQEVGGEVLGDSEESMRKDDKKTDRGITVQDSGEEDEIVDVKDVNEEAKIIAEDGKETTGATGNEKGQNLSELSGTDVSDEKKHETDASDHDIAILESKTEVDGESSAVGKLDPEGSGQSVESGDGNDVSDEGKLEQTSEIVDSDVATDVCEAGKMETESSGDALQQNQERSIDSEEASRMLDTQKTEEVPAVDVSTDADISGHAQSEDAEKMVTPSESKEDQKLFASSDEVQAATPALVDDEQQNMESPPQDESGLKENHGGSTSVSETYTVQTGKQCEAELDHSVSTNSEDGKVSTEDVEVDDMKSKEMSKDQSQTEAVCDEEYSKTDPEDVEKDSNPESVQKEERNEESGEMSDTLSPILDSKKPVRRELSEGGTSEDSSAQLDDEYDFDDIDDVLDHDSPVANKRKDSKPNVDGDSDDKQSFGSKDSGLQDSVASKDSGINKEDAVSFGSRDSGLQDSGPVKETGLGDTVSTRSGDSEAGEDSSSGKPASEAEEGAVGGSSEGAHPVAGSRESLDLEAKLDKLASQESMAKEAPSKEKHGHKKSKKFKMFKKIFK